MKPKRPAQAVHRRLRSKLEHLAAHPGTKAEGKAAAKKLKRLLKQYDFKGPDLEDIFAGFQYERSSTAYPVAEIGDLSLIAYVKWAIEESTPIRCVFAGSVLIAEATPRTTQKLQNIARVIVDGFGQLWQQFETFPTINSSDRGLFWRGLYDGMMNQQKPLGEPLPTRAAPTKATRRVKKTSVAFVAGLNLHPYSVAVGLGKQIRFAVPLVEISQQLEQLKPKELQ